MELRYFWIIPVIIILEIGVLLWRGKKTKAPEGRRRIANGEFLKKTAVYQETVRNYRICYYVTIGLLVISIVFVAILTARPVSVNQIDNSTYNRDIMLCMDVSESMDEINYDIIESYKKIVEEMKGERFGVTIFNTSPQLLVPLTQDYVYVGEALQDMRRSFDVLTNAFTENDVSVDDQDEDYYYLLSYLTAGTTIGEGSSKAGNGLAACAYGFPEEDGERSRIIILSTDNEVYGGQVVDVAGAARIAKERGVKVFVVAPNTGKSELLAEMRTAAETTGGTLYAISDSGATERIIAEIEATEKTLLEGGSITTVTDHPEVLFVVLVILFGAVIILEGFML